MLQIDWEKGMWKITTRGFTLEEVLVMAAMNLLVSDVTAPNRDSSGTSISTREVNLWTQSVAK